MQVRRCALKLVVSSLLFSSCSVATADEICGLPSTFDVIFTDGFESAVPAAVLARPTLAQLQANRTAHVLTAPTITITAPSSGASVADNKTDVIGTFTGPDNTGIAIGTLTAYTHNGQFVVPAVPLASGANTITATATTIDAQTSSAAVGVTGQLNPAPLTLSASANAGFAPFTVSFRSLLRTGTIQSVGVDYDGDGTDDYTGAVLPSSFTHTYSAPGVYAVRLTIHTSQGPTYTSIQHILIQDLTTVKATVCGVFGYFRQNLSANQITTATQAFGDIAKNRYTTFLNGLGATNAGQVATQLGTIANGVFGVDRTSLIVAATVNNELLGFTVVIARGDDGVWRITDL